MTQTMGRRWWEGAGCSYRMLSGVFEGGGAKGVAYSGALQAVHETICWFNAVAGASAGAITAAMVASGLDPKEIAEQVTFRFPAQFTTIERAVDHIHNLTEGYCRWDNVDSHESNRVCTVGSYPSKGGGLAQ